ncbi:hypothetical protein TNCV_5001601 [Trichonephila clavipes]|nr:hypothetical protein TNCV_5001601 [Trichonephila clavipes]
MPRDEGLVFDVWNSLQDCYSEVKNYKKQKILVRVINSTNERRLFQRHETTPLKVKADIEDVSSEMNEGD